jgi:hypothetical protein
MKSVPHLRGHKAYRPFHFFSNRRWSTRFSTVRLVLTIALVAGGIALLTWLLYVSKSGV